MSNARTAVMDHSPEPAQGARAWPSHAFVAPDPRRRWARILRATAHVALSTGDVHRLVCRRGAGALSAGKERLKTLRSIRTPMRHGLLADTGAGPGARHPNRERTRP